MRQGELLVVWPDCRYERIPNEYPAIKAVFEPQPFDFTCNSHLGAFVSDTGLLDALLLNVPVSFMLWQPIYGPAVITNPDPDDEGDTLPAPEPMVRSVIGACNAWRSVRARAEMVNQVLDFPADPTTVPPPMFIALPDDWKFGDPLPDRPE